MNAMQLQSLCTFITSNNTTSLRIPSRFTRDHREHILLNKVILIVSDDISWDLSLTVSSDGNLWLQKGWTEFAKLYGLKFGYMLLFNHLGKSVFQVRIFDPASCEINYSQVIKVPKHVMTQELYQCLTQDADDNDHVMAASTKKVLKESALEASFFKIILRDSEDFISLSSLFTKKYMEKSNKTQTIVIKTNSSTTEWNVKYLMIDGKYYLMDGWLKFMRHNGVRFGDLLVFWLVSHSPTVFNVFIYAPNTCLKYQSSCSANYIDPATPKVGNSEEGATFMEDVPAACDVSVKNIKKSMSMTIRKTYIHYIPLTKEFENATGIGDYGTLLLKNKEGKKWEVDIKRYNSHKQQLLCITKGWTKFMKDNKIHVGDKCKFKHVKGKLVLVHVFKKNGRPLGNKSNGD